MEHFFVFKICFSCTITLFFILESSTIIDDEEMNEDISHVRKKRDIIFNFGEHDVRLARNRTGRFSRSMLDRSWLHKSFKTGRKKRKSENNEYFIEILLVVDKGMAEYYKSSGEDLIHYILTLMSHVSISIFEYFYTFLVGRVEFH